MKLMTLSDTQRPRTHLFTVRVRIEHQGDGKTEWRGQVKQVMSGEVQYFRDWTTLISYLTAMLPKVKDDESTGTN